MSNFDVFSEVAVATYEHKRKTPTSSIEERNFLINRLGEKGKIKNDIKGGLQITEPLVLGENQTIQNIYGGQRFNTGSSNITAQLAMGWSEKVMVVSITRRELNVNRSKEQIFDLADQKMEAARQTAENRMGMEVYSSGAGYESLFGLPSFITTSGGGAYGGVDPNLWPRWRNQVVRLPTGYTTEVLEDSIIAAVIASTDGADKPDCMAASVKHWKMLEKSQRSKTRNVSLPYMKEAKANMGFDSISYGNLDIFWDQNSIFGMDLDMSFGLCTDHLYLFEHPEGRWEFDKGTRPIDSLQNVMVAPWMGGMVCKKRRCQFVVTT